MKNMMKKGGLALLGAGVLALPLAIPNTAHADGLNVHLSLGAPVYSTAYYEPTPVAVRYVPAPAPVRVTNYYPRPVYQRVVFGHPRAYYVRHDHHRHHRHAWRHHRGHDRVAYRW